MLGKRVMAALCVSLLLLPAGLGFAQSEKKAEKVKKDDSTAVADDSKQQKQKPKTGEKEKKDALEMFIPSEDISEDLSVSFPVDI